MNKYIVVDKVPREFRYKYLGSGANASCYMTSDGRSFKEYESRGVYDSELEKLVGLEWEGFVFPEQLVFLNEVSAKNFIGFIKKYVKGSTLGNLDAQTSIRDLIAALKVFERNSWDFSYEKDLFLYDLNPGNLIYTPDKEIIDIDTDCVSRFPFPYTNPAYENTKELANSLKYLYIEENTSNYMLNECAKECLYGGYVKLSTYMSNATEEMEKYFPVETVNDYEKGLTLLKR